MVAQGPGAGDDDVPRPTVPPSHAASASEHGHIIHPLLRGAFVALDAKGVEWALLRGGEHLAAPRSDVDVLVHPSASGEIDRILASAGFVHLRAHGHGTHRFYLCYEDREDAWIKIDVVLDVAFGRNHEFRTALAPVLLARRRRLGPVAYLGRDEAFWHLLLHHLLGGGDVPVRRRGTIVAAAAQAGDRGPLRTLIDELHPRLASRLRAAVAEEDWDSVQEMGRQLRRVWRRRAALAVTATSTRNRIARHLRFGMDGGGMSLALLGPDGAGKTTLAEGLRASVPIPARYVYLGIWRESRFDEHLRRILGARLAVRLLRLLSKAALIAYHRQLGRLVVLDRYTCDADLPAPDLDLKARLSAKLVRHTNADPDLIILLDAPVELMYARKHEHGLKELQLRRGAYLAMADRFPQMVVIDAAQSLEEVRRRATKVLWENWSAAVRSPTHQ